MDALLRRRAMIAAGGGEPPTPPGPVTTIPYIRGGYSGEYIDTGITPDETTRIILWARNISPTGSFVWILGSRVSGTSAGLTFALPDTTYTGSVQIQFGNNTVRCDNAFRYLSNYHKYEISAGQLLVDDTVIATGTSSSFSNSRNIYLFGMNANGALAGGGRLLDISACKIYKGGALVRDYTAVNSPSIGLYDAVSDTVFTNAGNGSFTYGTFNPNAYTPLEYVECTGESYIDTGIYGTYSMPIVTKFQPRSSATGFHAVFGARTSSSSGMCYVQVGNNTRADSEFSFNFNNAMRAMWTAGSSQTGHDFVVVKKNNTATLYESNTSRGTQTVTTDSTFATTYPMYIGAFNNAGGYANRFKGYLHFVGFGSSANFVPAKVNGVAGLYDTLADVFYGSETSTPFVAGPEL